MKTKREKGRKIYWIEGETNGGVGGGGGSRHRRQTLKKEECKSEEKERKKEVASLSFGSCSSFR